MENAKTGRMGEQQACEWLEKQGHVILERNWRHSHLEIDIISLSEGNKVHIVEVKSRREPVAAAPQLSVNRLKQKRIASAAQYYIHQNSKLLGLPVEICFDIITVVFSDSGTEIEYYPQAYIPTYVL